MVPTLTLEQTRDQEGPLGHVLPTVASSIRAPRTANGPWVPDRWGASSSTADPLSSCRRHDLLQGGAPRGGSAGDAV